MSALRSREAVQVASKGGCTLLGRCPGRRSRCSRNSSGLCFYCKVLGSRGLGSKRCLATLSCKVTGAGNGRGPGQQDRQAGWPESRGAGGSLSVSFWPLTVPPTVHACGGPTWLPPCPCAAPDSFQIGPHPLLVTRLRGGPSGTVAAVTLGTWFWGLIREGGAGRLCCLSRVGPQAPWARLSLRLGERLLLFSCPGGRPLAGVSQVPAEGELSRLSCWDAAGGVPGPPLAAHTPRSPCGGQGGGAVGEGALKASGP